MHNTVKMTDPLVWVSVVTQHRVALELLQVRTTGIDLPTRSGVVITNTPASIRAEMKETWERVRGREGEEMRERCGVLRGVMETSWREGLAREMMGGLSGLLTETGSRPNDHDPVFK